MPDDPQDISRSASEIETLRARYRRHREALARLESDAPTESLSLSYARLRREIENSLATLDQLDAGAAAAVLSSSDYDTQAAHDRPAAPVPHPARPFLDQTEPASPFDGSYEPLPEPETQTWNEGNGMRLLLIGIVGLVVVGMLGYFIWRYAGARDGTRGAGDIATGSAELTASPEPSPSRPAGDLTVSPETWNYQLVRKGTRKTHDFQLTNETAKAIPIKISRSDCRCLWFDHPSAIPPNGSATLTVTVDGARAKAGDLTETVEILGENGSKPRAVVEITATIR